MTVLVPLRSRNVLYGSLSCSSITHTEHSPLVSECHYTERGPLAFNYHLAHSSYSVTQSLLKPRQGNGFMHIFSQLHSLSHSLSLEWRELLLLLHAHNGRWLGNNQRQCDKTWKSFNVSLFVRDSHLFPKFIPPICLFVCLVVTTTTKTA